MFIVYIFQMSSQGTIRCSKETQNRLKEKGRMGESFEKRIIRLLDESSSHLERVVNHEI